MSADPIALITPPESLSGESGVRMGGGSRASSEIDAYGGAV